MVRRFYITLFCPAMQHESLIIRRFGPIEEIELPDIKRFNVFIGESGSGKSTIMKVLAMMRWIFKMSCVRTYFKNSGIPTPFRFRSESILSANGLKYFIRHDSELIYTNGSFQIILAADRLTFPQKNVDTDKLTLYKIVYISDKRVLIPDLAAGNVTLRHNMFYLDETFLNYQKALEAIPEAEMGYLGVKLSVKRTAGGRRVVVSSNREDGSSKFDNLPLASSSSGLQSSVALHLITSYLSRYYNIVETMNSTIIKFLAAGDNLSKFSSNLNVGDFPNRRISLHLEEPELSLFPSNQWGLMKYLIGECLNSKKADMDLTMATHSPYILTALNIMILAYKAWLTNADKYNKLGLTVPQINPNFIGAWSVDNGRCLPLFNSEIGMIDGSHLDNTSDVYEDLILTLNEIIYG